MTHFRRLVLELGHGAVDTETMRQAAAFAHVMDAELHALFVEDETLLRASALPFAREISLLSCQWRPFEPDRLEAELRAAADRARQQLMEVAQATGIRRSFEVRRGDLASHVTDTCVATDIVVISSPRQVGTAHGVRRLSETAHRSVASVLFLPPQSGRRQGVIVAVAVGAGDPALEVARLIAAQKREGLLVLVPAESDITAEGTFRVLPSHAVRDIVAVLGETREQLIVVTRDGEGEATDLAAARGVPVLMLEPA